MEVDESLKYKAGLELGDLGRRRGRGSLPSLPQPPAPLPFPPLPTARSPSEPSQATTGAELGPSSHRADSSASGGGYPAASPAPAFPSHQGKVPCARSRYQQTMMLGAGSQQVRGMGGGGGGALRTGMGVPEEQWQMKVAGKPEISGGDLGAGRLRHHPLRSPPGGSC